MKHPHCYVRCINQEYYNNEMEQLTFEQALSECIVHDELIIKDSVNSSGGNSVEKLLLKGSIKDREKDLLRVFAERKHDFVIQECLKQHSSFSKYNETSINTLRITSLYLNGKFTVLSIILRFGQKGMNVDNWGACGIIVGVDVEGNLCDYGYDIYINRYDSYNGIRFSNQKLTQVPDLLRLIEKEHTTAYSLCKFIGWDICYNELNEPIIIELNTSQPGVIGEQLCTGPIFGDRTQEVIDYCRGKDFKYSKSLLTF